jgi:adenosylcobinamide-GDP ribazoletransferase
MQPLIIAFQLLTRIPIPIAVERSSRNQGYSILFYPLVGAVIGGILVLFAELFALLFLDHFLELQAALILILWVGLTGGLHLDGLADSADSWVGGMGDRERMLEIMKDPSSGPMGVTAIVLLLLLKWSALLALFKSGDQSLLIWAPLLARTLLIGLFQTTLYLRERGMGGRISENIPNIGGVAVQVVMFGAAIYFGVGWLQVLLLFIAALIFRWLVVKQLGGITGDVAGAMVEKMEALLLILIVLL